MSDVYGGAPGSAPVEIVTVTVRRRTIRRRQRKEIMDDLLTDMDNISTRIDNARTKQEKKAYENLYDIVSGAYNKLVDSEV